MYKLEVDPSTKKCRENVYVIVNSTILKGEHRSVYVSDGVKFVVTLIHIVFGSPEHALVDDFRYDCDALATYDIRTVSNSCEHKFETVLYQGPKHFSPLHRILILASFFLQIALRY